VKLKKLSVLGQFSSIENIKVLLLIVFMNLTAFSLVGIKNVYGSDDFSHPDMEHVHQHKAAIPIGVMGAHTHAQGEWMTSYRYMRMDMPEHYSGTKKQTVDQVHNNFMISPVDMTMEMHMLGLMYGVTDEFTAMLMFPYVLKDMEHRRRMDSKQFSTHAQGVGDIKMSALYLLKGYFDQSVHLNFGVSIPTGSIDRKDDTLMGVDQDLPYPMQLGSGTYDVHPGVTYADSIDKLSWGAQTVSVVRFGKNEHEYRLGNQYEVTSWLSYQWQDWMNTSFRIKGSVWGNVDGADQRLNSNMVPTADPDLRGGERIDVLLGANFLGRGVFENHQMSLEFGWPVYQNLDGPQLGIGLHGTIGWQKAF